MKSIRIHINELGLIRNSDLEIKPVVLFSGESGLGKSYLAVLSHYMFVVLRNAKRLHLFFKDKGYNFYAPADYPENKSVVLSVTREELEEWLSQDAVNYLRYMLGHDGLTADFRITLPPDTPDVFDFVFERVSTDVAGEEKKYNRLTVWNVSYRFDTPSMDEESPYAFVFRHAMIQGLFGDFKALDKTYVLPPSRGSYMSEKVYPKTGLWEQFDISMTDLKRVQEIPDTVSTEAVQLLHEIMAGDVVESGDSYVYRTSDTELPISAAAASVREIGPLQLMVTKRDLKTTALLIEEPEAHLHPLKQRMMADIVCAMAKAGAYIQVTTHSDYFLRRVNDHLRLHILEARMGDERYNAFCAENGFNPLQTLDSELLNAYYLEMNEDGTVGVIAQDSSRGVPFDSFKSVNGKFMSDSAVLYDMVYDV